MPTWLSGNELTERWDILGFELLNYVIEGLQPYNRKTGQPVPSPETRSKKNSLEDLRNRILGRVTLDEYITSHFGSLSIMIPRSISTSDQMRLKISSARKPEWSDNRAISCNC